MPESGHYSGTPADLGPATPLTYAIGDIHGSLPKLRRLIAQCEQHAAGRPATFVFLGDYIDRGPQSAGVIRFVIDLQSRLGNRVIALTGNHEAMVLDVVDGTTPEEFWLQQGGAETLLSYRVASAGQIPPADLDWMRSLPVGYDDGRRFFVHAGIDPERPLADQDRSDLIWIREPFLSAIGDYGRLVVHGHTPLESDRPDVRSNRVNIDTGAVFGGPLTAAVFAEGEVKPITFLQAP
jgi:serine/threonine protein phosphatase 1